MTIKKFCELYAYHWQKVDVWQRDRDGDFFLVFEGDILSLSKSEYLNKKIQSFDFDADLRLITINI